MSAYLPGLVHAFQLNLYENLAFSHERGNAEETLATRIETMCVVICKTNIM
jgi:hypothetical protein